MADHQEKLLAEFQDRMKQLIALCELLKRQNAALREEVEQKNSEIAVLKDQAGQYKTQSENLKFARAFGRGNHQEVQLAKQRLDRLVREVDKCIALLKIG